MGLEGGGPQKFYLSSFIFFYLIRLFVNFQSNLLREKLRLFNFLGWWGRREDGNPARISPIPISIIYSKENERGESSFLFFYFNNIVFFTNFQVPGILKILKGDVIGVIHKTI